MKWLSCLLVGVLAVAALSDCRADGSPATPGAPRALKEGLSFSQARAMVLRQGWLPYRSHTTIVPEGEDGFPYSTLERELVAKGMVEVSSCSMGKTLCLFVYAKGQQCLQLETEGERMNRLRLIHWAQVPCPPVE